MRTRQTIAIIGATGNMGSSLAKSLSKGNYRLLLLDRNPLKATELVAGIKQENPQADIAAHDCAVNACWEADIIIMAVPLPAEKRMARKIKEVANQKIVISISNPLADSYDRLLPVPESSAAEELQELLPHCKVVKAFNTTLKAAFATPATDGRPADAFVAGNDQEAVQTVAELVQTAGFHPVIAGNLAASRRLEKKQFLLMQLGLKTY